MLYNLNDKNINVNDKEVENLISKYDLSIEEATKMWLEDNDYLENKEVEEMTAKAKENVKRYEKSDKERKKTTRERKIDETKKHLMGCFKVLLEGLGAAVQPLTTEAEMHFTFNSEQYTIKLIKHRPPKQK